MFICADRYLYRSYTSLLTQYTSILTAFACTIDTEDLSSSMELLIRGPSGVQSYFLFKFCKHGSMNDE